MNSLSTTTNQPAKSKPTRSGQWRVIHPDESQDVEMLRTNQATTADSIAQLDQNRSIVIARNLTKSYVRHKTPVPVLKGVDFSAEVGKITAIVGQSGSGKSTLLHLLGTLDQPDQGEIEFAGRRIDNLPRRERDRFRNQQLGMIFQFYHLLPELTLLENVIAPAMIGSGVFSYWTHRRTIISRAKELIGMVGLSHRLNHKPCELSGGEMQRTAIARALITDPTLLLADEPTGNLDQESGGSILNLLKQLNKDTNLTIVMVTHDETIAQQCDALVRLKGGKVERLK